MTAEQFRRAIAAMENMTARLEEASPAPKGLRHPTHQATLKKSRAAVESIMRAYFGRQHDAILKDAKSRIQSALIQYAPPLKEAKRSPEANLFAQAVIPEGTGALRMAVTSHEVSNFDSAVIETIAQAAKTIAGAAPVSDTAAERWLRENSLSKLASDISDETKDQLRAAVGDAWEAGGNYDSVVEAIQNTFEGFSDYRAGMIAQTEMNDAYNFGRDEMARANDYNEKAWDPDGTACEEICMPNVDQGWIGIDEAFESGDDAPPAHPWCDCGTNYRKSSSA
jgi:hypothetical protein